MSAKIFCSNNFDSSLSSLSDLTLPPLRLSSPPSTSDDPQIQTSPRPVPLILQPELSTVRQLSTQLQPFLHIQPFMVVQPISQLQLFNEMTIDPTIIEAGIATHSFVQEINNLAPSHTRLCIPKAHPNNYRHTEGNNLPQCFLQTSEKPVVSNRNHNDDKENTPPPRILKEVTCEECGKIYRGKNARSILRRHLKDKHKIEQPRATRWDNDPNRPKTDEERRQRMLESKRKSAQKARAKKNLMKEMAQQENTPVTDASITQNLTHRLKQWSITSTPSSTPPRFVRAVNSPNNEMPPYST
ncbi:6087_t:CDS:2, partial [Acaulospora colombiana]